MVFGLIKREILKSQSTENIRITYLNDWSNHFPDDEVSRQLFVVSIKPGVKLIHHKFMSSMVSNEIKLTECRDFYWNDHPSYKSIAIENKYGKLEAVSIPKSGRGKILAVFICDFCSVGSIVPINRDENIVFVGAILKDNGHNRGHFNDDFYRVALGYVNNYFKISFERKRIDEDKKRTIEIEELEKKQKKEAEAKRILDERIRKEKETKEKAEKEEKERKEKRDKEDKLRLEEHERKQEELRVKALEEQERLYKLRMEEETRAQIARIESETKAFEKRKQIEFQELERIAALKKQAMEEEARLTGEILRQREELERLEIEANQKTVEQLLSVLKSGG